MKRSTFVTIAGMSVIGMNVIFVGVVFLNYLVLHHDTTVLSECPELFAILGPLLAVYITAYVKMVIEHPNGKGIATGTLGISYISLTFLFLVLYCVFIISAIFMRASGGIGFTMLKKLIEYSQVFFGAYLGLFLNDLFGHEKQSADHKRVVTNDK